jgi:glucosamine-6-phosphate deaminase
LSISPKPYGNTKYRNLEYQTMTNFSRVEQAFYRDSGSPVISTAAPYILVDNFPKLGLLSALSFLEWVSENPDGVISLPTSKTAQHFLKNTNVLLENWNNNKGKELLERYGLGGVKKPDLRGLQFVQAGEFYPIHSVQHNSLWNFVDTYYIKAFEFDRQKALLINSDEIELAEGKMYDDIFPGYLIDLSLRFREAKNHLEKLQQESIFKIDNWCDEYEGSETKEVLVSFWEESVPMDILPSTPGGPIIMNPPGLRVPILKHRL